MTDTNIYDIVEDKSYLDAIAKRNTVIDYLNNFKIDDGNECKPIGIKKDTISKVNDNKVKIEVGDNLNKVISNLGNEIESGCVLKDSKKKETTAEVMFNGLEKMLADKFNDHNFVNILKENFEKGKTQYKELGQKAVESQINNLGLNDVVSCIKKSDTTKGKTETKKTMKKSILKKENRKELTNSFKSSFKRNTEKDNEINNGIFEIKTKSGQIYEVEIDKQKNVKLYRYNKTINGVAIKEAGTTEISLNALGKGIGNTLSKKIIGVLNEKNQTIGVRI